ncbi:hypothetical protein JCM4814A_78740 [Streptomyces phaeofaciens JCM 4814]|uniref:Uncharacterized protein n=1 Tax=Streptomyces phaeofaciens TaxID=68254 RepID=A0A918HR43_9ACTN|nr:hypothetical protein [Streptomyces phaeofaciens]GGT96085.1 hypothetical protein GCM10010226_87110 [Streptomyces phaeofaciens]
MSFTRPRDPLAALMGTLWLAGHLIALALVGVLIHDSGQEQTSAAVPDTPLGEPDLPVGPGAA